MSFLNILTKHISNPKYTHEHLNGNNLSYQKFILLTYKRTGSNYLSDLLRSHPQIVSFGSLFGKKNPAFLYPDYPSVTCKMTLNYRNNQPIEFLEKNVFRSYHQSIKAVGFKMNYDSEFHHVIEYLKQLPDLKVIHLIRNNYLKIYLSDMIASYLNKWHAINIEHKQFIESTGTESRVLSIEKNEQPILKDDFHLELKYEDCLNEFIKIKDHVENFRKYFKPEQTLDVYYEDLLKNSKNVTGQLLSFLNTDQIELTSRFVKINNKKSSEIISNFYELKKQFSGTEWEVFFEE